ncbi:bifunctional glycosyltransferase/class I SAM-dependent methyltransferase [Arthrobacter sp. NEB 688]|uniref:bifunctional glycosyltransferase/class I SAM-dependent methyltransferase n=1 Tax=Arthrobacter sp. NEB 688 TaxID=904039 RepID=UPI0015674506|nr:bifunctional glycosyltransferase/class I SAM-dependent methyltransferase [Arthrobacter sp. NEB 688]QKE85501.1 methyltransferase domain-containing protein [Arthrobacter sp. NEB 688]
MSTARVSQRTGAVVLAAYRPDPDLFAVQLRSIRDQTRSDFRCLVGADGGQDEVRRLVTDAVGDDPRFEVVGWDDNVGFYLNFERLLAAVPAEVGWVALCDQDDRWYPDKLERLVPLLDDAALALGQARVVTWPRTATAPPVTARRVVSPVALLLGNQVTGCFSVLRRDLLDVALPFPRFATVTQLHDHWLGVCASVTGGYVVLDAPVQDYLQHGRNLVGETDHRHPRTPWGVVRTLHHLREAHPGLPRPGGLAAVAHATGIGWRRTMVETLRHRLPGSPAVACLDAALGRPGVRATSATVARGIASRQVATGTALTLVAGLPRESVASLRRSRPRARQAGTDPRRHTMDTDAPAGTCWLCDAPTSTETAFAPAGYVRCTACGFLFQAHRASAEDEARMYDGEYFEGYDQRTGGRRTEGHYDVATAQRQSEARVRVEFLRGTVSPPARLLEVGAASGYFVAAAAAAGFDAQGVEPSTEQAEGATARGIPVRSGTLADIAAGGDTFDVLCAWHVLEHLPEPRAALEQMRGLLRPGGVLALELPNIGSVAAQRNTVRWAHLDPGAHVGHYTPRTLASLLGGAGLEVERVETFSIRRFSRTLPRRLLHAGYDAVALRTPRLVHPSRHELLRAVARRPATDR